MLAQIYSDVLFHVIAPILRQGFKSYRHFEKIYFYLSCKMQKSENYKWRL